MTATDVLSVVIVVVSLLAWQRNKWFRALAFWPYGVDRYRQWYRWLTSVFVHADMWHLLINVFVLYSFGNSLETLLRDIFGLMERWVFLGLFVAGGILSEVATYRRHRHHPNYLSVGASGAVAAVLFAFVLWEPWDRLLIWGVLPVPAILLAGAYLLFSAYMDRRSDQTVNHSAHLWGGIIGVLYMILVYPPVVLHFISRLIH